MALNIVNTYVESVVCFWVSWREGKQVVLRTKCSCKVRLDTTGDKIHEIISRFGTQISEKLEESKVKRGRNIKRVHVEIQRPD